MARLVGLIANRPDLCNRFAVHESRILDTRKRLEEPWGWGVGFFQGGELLLKRRPLDERAELSIGEMIGNVRSDLMLAHVRRATVGSHRTDNTHPFRYRQWMFASTGTVGGFGQLQQELSSSLPRFLKRSVRGDTDSELLFHLFLSFLHDSGQLDRLSVPPNQSFPALQKSLALLERLCKNNGLDCPELNVMLATPDYILASHQGGTMAHRTLAGRDDFEPLFDEEGPSKLSMPDLEPCRLSVVASDFDEDQLPDGWTEVPKGAMVAFTRTSEPRVLLPASE